MRRIYKSEDGSILFQQAWQEDDEVSLCWGTVGAWGQAETYLIDGEYVKEPAIEDVLSRALSEGYKEIPFDEHKVLVVMHPFDDPNSRRAELKTRAIQEILAKELFWTGNGSVDFCELLEKSFSVRCLVVDEQSARKNLEKALKENNLWEGISIQLA